MRILLAPDSFKGSISSVEFCNIAKKAILDFNKHIDVLQYPMADGGEGTAETVAAATGGEMIRRKVTGPLGDEVDASYGICGDGKTAVVELASASGLPLVPEGSKNPMITTTYGTGELIKDALDRGCNKIILGLGGSATNDCATGLLTALGARFHNKEGYPVSRGAKGLLEIDTIDISDMDVRLKNTSFTAACDVDNALYGPKGAAYVYGPQKGATPQMLEDMDRGLENFAVKVRECMNQDVSEIKGAGAAGGAGAGVTAFLNAELKPGAEIIKDIIGFNDTLKKKKIDLIITGEGEMNFQTAFGKLPVSVAREAKKYDIPVVALVGKIGEGAEDVHNMGIDGVFSIANGPITLEYAMKNSKELIYRAVGEIVRFYCSLYNKLKH